MKYDRNVEFHNSYVLVSVLKYDGSVQVRDFYLILNFGFGFYFALQFFKIIIILETLKSSDKVTVGGIDKGQGMHTRCAQVAAQNLECDLDIVRVKPTNTEVSPNSAPTGGTISTHAQMLLINKVRGLPLSFSFSFNFNVT